jgi:predicted RNase H-like HicB family nuclease
MTHRYTVVLEREEDGGYHAFCPALPGCHSQGDSLDEAMANIKEAMELYLESLTAHNEPLPVEDIVIKPVEITVAA